MRPIAVGCVLRRLIAKIACFRVLEGMSSLFSPLQLGCEVKGGVEAAVHAGHLFLDHLSPDDAVVKLDFCNAFNTEEGLFVTFSLGYMPLHFSFGVLSILCFLFPLLGRSNFGFLRRGSARRPFRSSPLLYYSTSVSHLPRLFIADYLPR